MNQSLTFINLFKLNSQNNEKILLRALSYLIVLKEDYFAISKINETFVNTLEDRCSIVALRMKMPENSSGLAANYIKATVLEDQRNQ